MDVKITKNISTRAFDPCNDDEVKGLMGRQWRLTVDIMGMQWVYTVCIKKSSGKTLHLGTKIANTNRPTLAQRALTRLQARWPWWCKQPLGLDFVCYHHYGYCSVLCACTYKKINKNITCLPTNECTCRSAVRPRLHSYRWQSRAGSSVSLYCLVCVPRSGYSDTYINVIGLARSGVQDGVSITWLYRKRVSRGVLATARGVLLWRGEVTGECVPKGSHTEG